jgi:AraC-like DNA-binding protein
VPDAQALSKALEAGKNTTLVAFHWVEFGHCEVAAEGAEPVLLTAGDMVFVWGGAAHQISVGRPQTIQTFASLLKGTNTCAPEITGQAPGTSLICGVFRLHHTLLNPLFGCLPTLMKTGMGSNGSLHDLAGVTALLTHEIRRSTTGTGFVIERLLEILCAQSIKCYIESAHKGTAGWFTAIRDRVAGRAIARMHSKPSEDWSVAKLAAAVTMSPSRFVARFTLALGDSPMSYLAKWRMNLACRLLADTDMSTERIASEIGYATPAAFNRAFKRLVGLPPATWRGIRKTETTLEAANT